MAFQSAFPAELTTLLNVGPHFCWEGVSLSSLSLESELDGSHQGCCTHTLSKKLQATVHLQRWFLTFSVPQNQREGLSQARLLGPTPRV